MVKTSITFDYSAYAFYAGRSLRDFYLDKQAAWEINEVAREHIRRTFGWETGIRMPYLAYASLTALGTDIVYPPDGQPMVARPIVGSPADLDRLPTVDEDRITAVGAMPHFIDVWRYLCQREGKEVMLGLGNEGPITAAMLVRGQDFMMDVMDDPAFVHRLLKRLSELFVKFQRGLRKFLGRPMIGGGAGMADDFAGMLSPAQYAEFVVPYYNVIYGSLGAERRDLHSELLRPDHLPLLADFKLDHFDPHTDQYLTVRQMVERMPTGISWNWRVLTCNVVTGTPAMLRREFEDAVRDGASEFQVAVSAPVKTENVKAVADVAARYGKVTIS